MTKELPLFERDLSWIEFNFRVFEEARNPQVPLLERLRFLGIVSSNFDEFFMVRVPAHEEQPAFQKQVYEKAFGLMREQEKYFREELLPQLEAHGIRRLALLRLEEAQRTFLTRYFKEEMLPLLTPIALTESGELPFLTNLALYRVFKMKKESSGEEICGLVELPKTLPRMITLPSAGNLDFFLAEDLVSLFARELFIGYEIQDEALLRIARSVDMELDEEKDQDFAKVMSEALRMRRKNTIVRMEASGSRAAFEIVQKKLGLPESRIFCAPDWIDLKEIGALAFRPIFLDLKYPEWEPVSVVDWDDDISVWDTLKQRDLLVHHPYESFDLFLRFLKEAAHDPDVLAIKQTLYRAAQSSHVVGLLEKAALSGKKVTVLIELKARFDEERNIDWANRLIQAGATVLYGVAGYKTHAKICLVVRREPEGLKRYVHLATGNYNERTARIYTDFGFFTSHNEMTQDATAFFNVVTGFSQPVGFARIDMAPYTLRQKLEKLIEREILRSTPDRPGLIILKMNSLADPDLISRLYRASQAGVHIRLNVRGICCLVPGLKGVSENIEVVSLVDRFLEHSRIFYFQNGGHDEIYLSSADWMPRNLDRRLEILFPLIDRKLKKRILDFLQDVFRDNQKARGLNSKGEYILKQPTEGEKPYRVQEALCHEALKRQKNIKAALPEIRPQKPKNN
ncbi:MAG TPA: polyphosphate kinase 1 [Candidatus Omnitrophica bacterium]|nr:polyphosphate kinase 1 [Candidatus Omnitrophota bacterium]